MTPAQHAHAAAEAVRSLNHATRWPYGYENPTEVDAVLGELLVLVDRLPQALDQARRWLAGADSAGTVGHDHDEDVATAVDTAGRQLLIAGDNARQLGGALAAACRVTKHLNGATTPEEDQP